MALKQSPQEHPGFFLSNCGSMLCWTVLGLETGLYRESLAWLWPGAVTPGILIQFICTRKKEAKDIISYYAVRQMAFSIGEQGA